MPFYDWIVVRCIHTTFYLHSSIDEHLGCVHLLTVLNSASMNIRVQVWVPVFSSFCCIPRNGISGSYGNFIFKFFEELHTIFQESLTNLHSHQQCMKLPIFLHPCQQLLFYIKNDSCPHECVRYYLDACFLDSEIVIWGNHREAVGLVELPVNGDTTGFTESISSS